MKSMDLLKALGNVQDSYVIGAEEFRQGKGKSHTKTLSTKRLLLIAAIISILAILGLTGYAAKFFTIRNAIVGVPGETYITLVAHPDSNEFRAHKEWMDLFESRRSGRVTVKDRIYNQYGAFTEESRDALIAIMEKYDLQPYTESVAVYDRVPQELYEAVGVSDFLPESCATYRGTIGTDFPGCSVRNASTILVYSDETRLPDGTIVTYELNNFVKGYMHDFLGIDPDLETIEEWDYTTADGTPVHLSKYGYNCMLMADLPNSFLCITVLRESEPESSEPLTKNQVEDFADMFDYKAISKIGSK